MISSLIKYYVKDLFRSTHLFPWYQIRSAVFFFLRYREKTAISSSLEAVTSRGRCSLESTTETILNAKLKRFRLIAYARNVALLYTKYSWKSNIDNYGILLLAVDENVIIALIKKKKIKDQ